jgi:AcrR family transcriptional regulator
MNRRRPYTPKRRAENQAETRRRIVEATVDLHTEVGPSRTSISAIAERAGVQRHTVYAHFPTGRELFLACSGLTLERDPLPDADTLRTIANPEQRLRRGLTELYAWYGRNAELANSVMRDAEVDPLTRDIVRLRMTPRFDALHAVLAQGFQPGRTRDAALGLAISFQTWRSLTQDSRLSADAAVEFVVRTIRCTVERRN